MVLLTVVLEILLVGLSLGMLMAFILDDMGNLWSLYCLLCWDAAILAIQVAADQGQNKLWLETYSMLVLHVF